MSKLEKEFDEIKFTHMGRDKNQFGDVPANLASMSKTDCANKVQPINIKVGNSLAHFCSIKGEVDENSWYYDIKQFIQQRK